MVEGRIEPSKPKPIANSSKDIFCKLGAAKIDKRNIKQFGPQA